MTIKLPNDYDFYGPFTISRELVYIKTHYVPFELGSLELQQVIRNNLGRLEKELMRWVALDEENEKQLKEGIKHEITQD